MKRLFPALMIAVVLAGCAPEPPKPAETAPAKEEPKPPSYETGRVALQRLYATARGWAADARPVRLVSVYTEGAPTTEGKAGVWRASFASPSQRGVKPYVWSGLNAEGAPERGVTPGVEDDYNPRNVEQTPFDMNFLKVDTTKAFEVAQGKGGAAILKKSPNTPITYELDWNPRNNQLVWFVIYGPSRNNSKLTVAVNATTGDFIRKVK